MDSKQRILFEKLLRLALCPSSAEGEWNVAAQKLVALMRSSGTKAEEVLSISSGVRAHGRQNYRPPSDELAMPFGKYKHCPIFWVAQEDPQYLFWVLANVQALAPAIREEIKQCLYHHKV